METFIEWLQQQLNQRQWTQADLARHSSVTQTHLSRIMNGMRKPGPDTLVNIARALRIPPDEAFRRAGLLPAKRGLLGSDQRQFDDLVSTIAALSPENQKLVLDLVERIKRSEEAEQGA